MIKIDVYTTLESINAFFTSVKHSFCAIDIETMAIDPGTPYGGLLPFLSKIRTIQIYDGQKVSICDFGDRHNNFISSFDFDLLPSVCVAHNNIFELSHFLHNTKNNTLNCKIYCSMQLYSLSLLRDKDIFEYKRDLKTVALSMFDMEIEKDSQKIDWGTAELDKERREYCALDVVLPYKIFQELYPKLEDTKDVYELNTSASHVIASITNKGFGIDVEAHTALSAEWESKKNEYERICYNTTNSLDKILDGVEELDKDLFKEPFDVVKQIRLLEQEVEVSKKDIVGNRSKKQLIKKLKQKIMDIDSGAQLSDYIKSYLTLEELKDFPRAEKAVGRLKTDADTLKEYANLLDIGPLVEYKKYQKLDSTYGNGFKEFIVNGKIHPNFTLLQTATGRMSSFKPNSQVSPRDDRFRAIFVPKHEDNLLLVSDFNQIEVRIASLLSRDQVLLDAYRTEKDVHAITASRLSGKRIEEVTKEDRQKGKACFTGDTEILTKKGWVRLENYNGIDMIATYRIPPGVSLNAQKRKEGKFATTYKYPEFNSSGGELMFEKPLHFKYFEDRIVYNLADRNVDIACTEDHELLYVSGATRLLKKEPLKDIKLKSKIKWLSSSHYDNNPSLSEIYTRILAMVVADGSFCSLNCIRLGFSKRRKYRRCEELLKKANIAYKRRIYNPKKQKNPPVVSFRINDPELVKTLLKYTTKEKDLYWSCIDVLDGKVFLEEAQFWDAHTISNNTTKKTRIYFSSSREQTVDVMQAMCCLNNVAATKYVTYSEKSNTKHYRLSYRFKPVSLWCSEPNIITDKINIGPQKVYCAQVSNGNILIRRNGKVSIQGNCVFGLLYGAGAKTLKTYAKKSYGVPMSDQEANTAVKIFRELYPQFRKWQVEVSNRAKNSLYTTTKLGKRITLSKEYTYTKSMNHPVQGTAAEIMLIAICLIHKKLNTHYDAHIVNIVHDEVIVECHKDCVDPVSAIIKDSMETAMLAIFPEATTNKLADVGVGKNWKDAK
jgi:DNA polymerase I-like protein with 3'-5' exonuclease and polymerase domains